MLVSAVQQSESAICIHICLFKTLRGRYRDFLYTPFPLTCAVSLIISIAHQNDTFFFPPVDEPTLIHHNHPKFIVYLRIHFWCCTFYGLEKHTGIPRRYCGFSSRSWQSSEYLNKVSHMNFFCFPVHVKVVFRDFSGGPVVRIHTFTAEGVGSIPGWGTKIPQAT